MGRVRPAIGARAVAAQEHIADPRQRTAAVERLPCSTTSAVRRGTAKTDTATQAQIGERLEPGAPTALTLHDEAKSRMPPLGVVSCVEPDGAGHCARFHQWSRGMSGLTFRDRFRSAKARAVRYLGRGPCPRPSGDHSGGRSKLINHAPSMPNRCPYDALVRRTLEGCTPHGHLGRDSLRKRSDRY